MDMITDFSEFEALNGLGNSTQQFCPECGEAMNECDRVVENGSTYIWYECGESNCNGSWLEKL